MDEDGEGDPDARLPASELDHLAQTLYGVIVALNAHVRRSHRPGSRAAQEVTWAIEQLGVIQGRLTRASQSRNPDACPPV
jgi:hypothetical protein